MLNWNKENEENDLWWKESNIAKNRIEKRIDRIKYRNKKRMKAKKQKINKTKKNCQLKILASAISCL